MPKVSVIIPTYNRAQLISRTINSVLVQTFKDFEILVVDDASTDHTRQVVKQIEDRRIRFISHQKNRGGSAARNTGIKASKGEYIGFLDDDDEWLPEKLEKQVEVLQRSANDVVVIYSACYFVSGRNNTVLTKTVPFYRGYLYRDLLRRNILPSPTPLIKKDCFSKAGLFDETLPSCQDWDMWIRISKYYKFDFVPNVLAKTYVHGKQISTNLNAKIVARERLIDKYREDLIKDPAILAFLLRRLGVLCCLSDNSKKALSYFLRSLKLIPIQKGCYAHILLTLLAPKWHNKYLRKNYVSTLDGITLFY
jgi:glycosyltransferase involved in cell wall biosynthesis